MAMQVIEKNQPDNSGGLVREAGKICRWTGLTNIVYMYVSLLLCAHNLLIYLIHCTMMSINAIFLI